MPRSTATGQACHFELSGGEYEQSLILLHGSGGSAKNWPARVKGLPGVNVYALDLPGHGQSSGEPPASVSAYADWVEGFVDGLGLEQVVLCGHSLGGAITLTLALRKPSWLTRIILVGTGARLRVHPAILAGVKNNADGVAAMMGNFVFGPDADRDAREEMAGLIHGATPAVLLNDFQACDGFDVMEQARDIRTPALVVCATHDQLTPVKYARYLADVIPVAELLVIEGAGHMVALEKANEFTAAVALFLGRAE